MPKIQSQDQKCKDLEKTKTNMLIGLIVAVTPISMIAFIVMFFVAITPPKSHENEPLTTSRVRKLWKETGMANSEYYDFKEDKSKATDDSIYFVSEDIPGEIRWKCRDARSDASCGIEFDGNVNTLGGYFWEKHWAEITKNLEKYPGLSARSMSQIEVYDSADLEEFAREILEIPDIEKLYRAYEAEIERSYDGRAAREFAYAMVYFMGEDREKYLFAWMPL